MQVSDVRQEKVNMETSDRKYSISYPSGKKFTAVGRYQLAPLDSWLVPCIFQGEKEVIMLDQRAIVRDDSGKVIYSPCRNRDGLQPQMVKWIDENQQWAKDLK